MRHEAYCRAQLPKRLAHWLAGRGHDALHTLDLPDPNATSDREIADLAYRQGRIIVSKDGDFVNSHPLQKRPPKLLWVATENTSNAELEAIVERHLSAIESALETSNFVELGRNNLIVHA